MVGRLSLGSMVKKRFVVLFSWIMVDITVSKTLGRRQMQTRFPKEETIDGTERGVTETKKREEVHR